MYAELESRSYGVRVLELIPFETEKIFTPVSKGLNFDIRSTSNKDKTKR